MNGQRLSYQLGEGKYLLLEEVDRRNPDPRAQMPVPVTTKDLEEQSVNPRYMAADNRSFMQTVELFSTPLMSMKSTIRRDQTGNGP